MLIYQQESALKGQTELTHIAEECEAIDAVGGMMQAALRTLLERIDVLRAITKRIRDTKSNALTEAVALDEEMDAQTAKQLNHLLQRSRAVEVAKTPELEKLAGTSGQLAERETWNWSLIARGPRCDEVKAKAHEILVSKADAGRRAAIIDGALRRVPVILTPLPVNWDAMCGLICVDGASACVLRHTLTIAWPDIVAMVEAENRAAVDQYETYRHDLLIAGGLLKTEDKNGAATP